MSDNNREQRNPFTLQGLLRFAVEATRAEDAPDPSSYPEMDADRREFLENAMKTMTIDVIEQLEKSVKTLQTSSSSESEQIEAMELLLEYIDNIDTANDFCKIGGLTVIIPCLELSPFSSVQSKAAAVIAELTQNNPFCQDRVLQANVIPKLINFLGNDEIAVSGLQAISCSIRGYEPAIAAFIDIGGLECLLGCLKNSSDDKVIIKSLFIIRSLCSEFEAIRDELVKLNATEIVVKHCHAMASYSNRLETALSTLCILVENSDALMRCQKSDLNLVKTLEEILKLSKDKRECEEIVEYCNDLNGRLFKEETESNTDS